MYQDFKDLLFAFYAHNAAMTHKPGKPLADARGSVPPTERWTTAPPKKYGKFDAGMSTNGMPLEGAGIEKQLFRQVCGRFACGITVITVRDEAGAVHGMTANSFTSVSLNPPLVLVCIDHRAKVLQHFRHSTHFGINVLSEHQRTLSDRFAGTGYDRFAGVDWHPGQTGVPLLTGVLGAIECARVKLVAAGDHDILIGRVVHAQCHEGEPLIYFASQYRRLNK